jgi:hypothetical protein
MQQSVFCESCGQEFNVVVISPKHVLAPFHPFNGHALAANSVVDVTVHKDPTGPGRTIELQQWRLLAYVYETLGTGPDIAVFERVAERWIPDPCRVEWRNREAEWWKVQLPVASGYWRSENTQLVELITIPQEDHELKLELATAGSRILKYFLDPREYKPSYKTFSGSPFYLGQDERLASIMVRHQAGLAGKSAPQYIECCKTAVLGMDWSNLEAASIVKQNWESIKDAVRMWEIGEGQARKAIDAEQKCQAAEMLWGEALNTLEDAQRKFSAAEVLVPQELLDLVDLTQAALLLPLDGYAYRSSDMVDMVLGKDWGGVAYDYCPTIQAFFRQIGQQVAARKQAQDLYWEEPPNSWLKRLWWRTPWAQLERLNRAKELYSYSRVGRMHQ